jgi:predicted transposase YdaD
MKVDAEDKIRKDERLKEKLNNAKKMKEKGIKIEVIAEITGLSNDEIEKL